MESGIYKITHIESGRYYVGQSENINGRLSRHKTDLRAGTHSNRHLQRAFDKYGEDAFSYEAVEFCHVKDLDETEQRYLDEAHALGITYNHAKYAKAAMRGLKHTEEAKKKMVAVQNTPEAHARQSTTMKRYLSDPEVREAKRRMMIDNHSNPEFRAKLLSTLRSPEFRQKAREHALRIVSTEKHKAMLRGQAKRAGEANKSNREAFVCEYCNKTVIGKGNFVRWHGGGQCLGKSRK